MSGRNVEVTPLALSRRDAAAMLGISRYTLDRRIADGTIRAVRIGDSKRNRLVIPVAEIERLVTPGDAA
jgi:excisionase family DNA binding protein